MATCADKIYVGDHLPRLSYVTQLDAYVQLCIALLACLSFVSFAAYRLDGAVLPPWLAPVLGPVHTQWHSDRLALALVVGWFGAHACYYWAFARPYCLRG